VCDVLEDIATAVKGKIIVLADGGVRTGVDVVKMLGLGADGVLIGRPFVTASFGGLSEGVDIYVKKVINEIKSTMILTGCQTIKDIDEKVIFKKA
jgi:isopentenyl diphosphate isomerase/L-lactate dehydrogenase-like FMN-dependent dehydrogenase